MKLRHNLAAGLIGSIWSAFVSFAAIPFYLRYLGIEAYGLIGFLATTQALMQILDFGLAATLNREVARGSGSGDIGSARTLLHTVAGIYWGVAGAIALVMAILAPVIIDKHWLEPSHLPRDSVVRAVMLMGLVIAARWPGQLYQGALMGAQRIILSSGLSVVMVTVGNVGAIAILAFVSPTVQAFLLWQAVVGLSYALATRAVAWRVIGRADVTYDFLRLRHILRFSMGMTGIAVSGILLSQLDKVILSGVLELREYGQYMLAVAVAGSLYVLTAPIFNVMYPRLSVLALSEDAARLAEAYRLSTRLLGALIFPAAMLLAVFSEEIIQLWTGNAEISRAVAPIIPFLAAGAALHGVMHLQYALQLASGRTRLPVTINIMLAIISVPLTLFLASTYGALGGAVAWLVLHTVYVILGTWMTHRQLLKGVGPRWLVRDVGIPLATSVLVGLVGHYATWGRDLAVYTRLAYGMTLAIIASVLALATSPRLRDAAFQGIRNWRAGFIDDARTR